MQSKQPLFSSSSSWRSFLVRMLPGKSSGPPVSRFLVGDSLGRLLQCFPSACSPPVSAIAFTFLAELYLTTLVLCNVMPGMTCHNMLDAPSKFEVPKQE